MILFPIFLILSLSSPFDFHESLLQLAIPLHNSCLSFINQGGELNFIYQSLICGESLPKNSFYQALRTLGLLHLMVISGTHMLLLERILSKILFLPSSVRLLKRGLLLFFLLLYAFIGLLKPPVVRAFVSLCLNLLNQKFQLKWAKHQRVLLSGAICLMIFPTWWTSYSLILSWAGSLALSLTRGIKKELCCFLLLYPLLLPLAPQSPVSLFSNWIFAPILTVFLFPLTLCAIPIPLLQPLIDFIWEKVESFLYLFTLSLPSLSEGIKFPLFWAWSYLMTVHFMIYFWKIYKKRNFK